MCIYTALKMLILNPAGLDPELDSGRQDVVRQDVGAGSYKSGSTCTTYKRSRKKL